MSNTTLNQLLTDIASEIRYKEGSSSPIYAVDFPDRIEDLPTGTPVWDKSWEVVE